MGLLHLREAIQLETGAYSSFQLQFNSNTPKDITGYSLFLEANPYEPPANPINVVVLD